MEPDENGNINCINCSNCSNCKDCVNCEQCYQCIKCYNCTGLCISGEDYGYCLPSFNCINCKDCVNCEKCIDCSNCDSCFLLNDCYGLHYSSLCNHTSSYSDYKCIHYCDYCNIKRDMVIGYNGSENNILIIDSTYESVSSNLYGIQLVNYKQKVNIKPNYIKHIYLWWDTAMYFYFESLPANLMIEGTGQITGTYPYNYDNTYTINIDYHYGFPNGEYWDQDYLDLTTSLTIKYVKSKYNVYLQDNIFVYSI